MIDDEENIHSDEEEGQQIAYQNNKNFFSQGQAQVEPLIQNENVAFQQSISKSIPLPINESTGNYEEDILLKSSSLDNFNDMNDIPYANSNLISNGQIVCQPIVQQIEEPIDQTVRQYDNINGTQQIYSTYPIEQNIETTYISPQITKNQNAVFASVQPMNNYNITSELIPEYNVDQNIIYSTPIPQTTTMISNYPDNTNIITSNIYSNDPNQITFSQNRANVVPINEQFMKNSKVEKYIKKSQKYSDSYLSNIDKKNPKNNILNYSQNSKFNKNQNNLRGNSSKKTKNNSSKNIRMNPNNLIDLKGIEEFSPDSWKMFYDKEDPFFLPISDGDIIPNQIINDLSKNEVYSGDINSKGKRHGFGRLITPIMERIGRWKNNQFNGWGREVRKTGEICEGKFVGDSLNGKGIYKDRNIFYLGDFENNTRQGKGEMFTEDYHYIGNFNNNEIDGKGRIELYNDGVYEGNFVKGEITGYGVFKFNNGDFYEGEMLDGKLNGRGKLTLGNGEIKEGKFIDGQFQEKEEEEENFWSYNV